MRMVSFACSMEMKWRHLLVQYVLRTKADRGGLKEGDFVARTIVTTRLISEIADAFDVPVAETLTGFKWIAAEILSREGEWAVPGGRRGKLWLPHWR